VAYELLRPVDLYSLWYVRTVASRTAPTLLRAFPILAAAYLFGWLQPPASAAGLLAWLAAQAGALFLGCAITTLLTLSLLWTISGEGISQLVFSLVIFLSGMNVPLPLFPGWMQPLLSILPFRGLIDTPFRLYLGHIPPSALLPALLHQAAWIAALVLAGRAVMARGLRKLSVQGG
jgi:ABC-2 type transport system permease protein